MDQSEGMVRTIRDVVKDRGLDILLASINELALDLMYGTRSHEFNSNINPGSVLPPPPPFTRF